MNYTTKVTIEHHRLVWFTSPDEQPTMIRWFRKQESYANYYSTPLTKGGKTEVTIQVFDEHGDPVIKFVGVAYCSMKDNFCYKLGREIAFGRALKQIEQWRDANGVFSVHDNF